MNPVIFLAIITYVHAKTTIFVTDTPIVQIAGRVYKKELLTNSYNGPKELSYDPNTRNLYFMYMDDEIQNSGRAFVNVENGESRKIDGIKFNKATAVDKESGEVFFGSENGLYIYDPKVNRANPIGLYNMNISKLVARNGELYLIDANNHMLYKVLEKGAGAVKLGDWKTVMEFDVDSEGHIYFVSMCGLFCAYKGHETIKNKELKVAYNFMVTEYYTLAMTENGIYKLDCKNGTAEKIGSIDFEPKSFVLGENGDMFYSINNDIFKLKPIIHYYIYNMHKLKNL